MSKDLTCRVRFPNGKRDQLPIWGIRGNGCAMIFCDLPNPSQGVEPVLSRYELFLLSIAKGYLTAEQFAYEKNRAGQSYWGSVYRKPNGKLRTYDEFLRHVCPTETEHIAELRRQLRDAVAKGATVTWSVE